MNTVSIDSQFESRSRVNQEPDAPQASPDLYTAISAIDQADLPSQERVHRLLHVLCEAFGSLAAVVSVGLVGDEIDQRQVVDQEGILPCVGVLYVVVLEARSHDCSFARLY